MTHSQKIAAYDAGSYVVAPPPVPHTYWNINDWVNYIDINGYWMV